MTEKISLNSAKTDYTAMSERNQAPHQANTKQNQKDSYEKTNVGLSSGNTGIYSKSAGVTADRPAVEKLKLEYEAARESLRNFVSDQVLNQGNIHLNLHDANTISQAKKAVSEKGFWGVDAVSDRIVNFAKAISGGDKTKADELRAAIEKGFKEAGFKLGGTLPSICSQTHDAIMSKLDAWVNGSDE